MTLGFNIGGPKIAEVIDHWAYTGGAPSASDCATLAAGISSAFASQLKSFLSSDFNQDGVTVLDLASTTGKQGSSATITNGTRSGSPSLSSTCVVFNHQIALRYRGGKPKNFWPLLDAGDLLNQVAWDATPLAAVAAAYDDYVTDVLALTSGSTDISAHVSISYYQGYNTPTTSPSGRVKQTPKLRVGGPVQNAIVLSTPRARVGTQRRRLGRS